LSPRLCLTFAALGCGRCERISGIFLGRPKGGWWIAENPFVFRSFCLRG